MEQRAATKTGADLTVDMLKCHSPVAPTASQLLIMSRCRSSKEPGTGITTEPESRFLDASESRRRDECEAIIAKGWYTFLDVGHALATIRQKRLYRDHYATFEDYRRQKWEYSRPQANRLIEAAAD